jgi:dTDP-4-dehydrorhamnose 3,5-epimerase
MGRKVCNSYSRGKSDLMKFVKTELEGALIIEIEKINDNRGFFSRSWDTNIFKNEKINDKIVQCNISFNNKKGTLRGMHFQKSPHGETKLIRCTKGKIFDVIIDLRPKSKTYKKWMGIELSQNNHKMLYVPKGFAHGFQTLEENSEVFYQMSEFYKSKYSSGVKWDDESFKINWPIIPPIISEKDLSFKLFMD